MKRIRPHWVLCVLGGLLALHASSADTSTPAKAPRMVMRTLPYEQRSLLADGLGPCLVSAQLSGQRPLVAVRPRANADTSVMKWMGLQDGDIITAVNGNRALRREDVVDAISGAGPASVLRFEIERSGQRVVIGVRVESSGAPQPADAGPARNTPPRSTAASTPSPC